MKQVPATSAPRREPAPLPSAQQAVVEAALQAHAHRPGPLLPVLHAVQDGLGHVPAAAVPLIAGQLNLSRAEVHGVLSFYHYFRQQPPGRQVIYLCRAEACQAVGAAALEAHVKARLGIDFGQTSADGRYTLEPAYCLGNCACGPSLMLGQELHGRVSAAGFDALIAEPA
jgi:formate dehydrogenase subunit gamma